MDDVEETEWRTFNNLFSCWTPIIWTPPFPRSRVTVWSASQRKTPVQLVTTLLHRHDQKPDHRLSVLVQSFRTAFFKKYWNKLFDHTDIRDYQVLFIFSCWIYCFARKIRLKPSARVCITHCLDHNNHLLSSIYAVFWYHFSSWIRKDILLPSKHNISCHFLTLGKFNFYPSNYTRGDYDSFERKMLQPLSGKP